MARIAYVARSNRADPVLLERFCTHFNFEPMVFDTADEAGRPVYHTNVLMTVATEFAMVGFGGAGPLRLMRGLPIPTLSETGLVSFVAHWSCT